jgi:Sec-independent protein translocase protein TatA
MFGIGMPELIIILIIILIIFGAGKLRTTKRLKIRTSPLDR